MLFCALHDQISLLMYWYYWYTDIGTDIDIYIGAPLLTHPQYLQ